MDTKINYAAVGGFVIILLVGIILGIMWLSSGLSSETYKMYRLYMVESVSGLSLDATVEFNGVISGSVTSIEVDPKNPQIVDVLLKVNKQTPITEGTTAMLSTRGLTGNAYISLNDKGTKTEPLMAKPPAPYPVIPTTPSLFVRLDTSLRDLTTNLKQISAAMQSILNKKSLTAINNTMLNLSQFTQALAANTKNLNKIMTNVATASDQIPHMLVTGRNTFQQIDNSIIPSAQQTISNLNQTVENISQLSSSIKDNPAVLIRGKTPQALGPGE